MGLIALNVHLLPLFSINSSRSEFWDLDIPENNAKVILRKSSGSQTQNWVLDLLQ